jgi:ThiF family
MKVALLLLIYTEALGNSVGAAALSFGAAAAAAAAFTTTPPPMTPVVGAGSVGPRPRAMIPSSRRRRRRRQRRGYALRSSPSSSLHQRSHDADNNNNNNNNNDLLPPLTTDEIARYSRHLVLSDVGMRGQQLLKKSAVLVIGAGGLGSPVLLYLAAAGVGHIGIVDADTVDASNLQRQIVHGTSSIGTSKCRSAQRRISDVNPLVSVRIYEQEFTSSTAHDIVRGGFSEAHPYQLVIDGSDNFPTKYLIKYVPQCPGKKNYECECRSRLRVAHTHPCP